MKINALALTGFFTLLLVAGQAEANQYTFNNITHNNATDAASGEAQLFVDVTDQGSNKIQFNFTNIGSYASSITDIYFDDDVPLMTFINFLYLTGGVDFTVSAAPPNLPGGNDPLYDFSSNYSYDSDSPAQPKGVNPGEALGLLFNLSSNVTFANVINALDDKRMRVGIHVQGFAEGGSESFINDPGGTTPVPEPATMLLFGAGLAGLAGIARRKMQ